MIKKPHPWRSTALAVAAVALLGWSAGDVFALSFGRFTVQSARGEPLRAEIEVSSITADEEASLQTRIATPATYAAAGLDYNPALSGLHITLARVADGRTVIRLSTDQTITESFVDVILEAQWAAGWTVRDYTMLLGPAPGKPEAPVSTLANASGPTAATPPDANPPQQWEVLPGESASQIAARTKDHTVSLDQMLVALLQANPEAFTQGNLNRLRSGAVLHIPAVEQVQSMPADTATDTVNAHSKDFNAFRRNLADTAPIQAEEKVGRQAAGVVEGSVAASTPGDTAVDRLTLSKGALQSPPDAAQLEREHAAQEAAKRTEELAKNIADLEKLRAASTGLTPGGLAETEKPGPSTWLVANSGIAGLPWIGVGVLALLALCSSFLLYRRNTGKPTMPDAIRHLDLNLDPPASLPKDDSGLGKWVQATTAVHGLAPSKPKSFAPMADGNGSSSTSGSPLGFDLGSLSLDLGPGTTGLTPDQVSTKPGDPAGLRVDPR